MACILKYLKGPKNKNINSNKFSKGSIPLKLSSNLIVKKMRCCERQPIFLNGPVGDHQDIARSASTARKFAQLNALASVIHKGRMLKVAATRKHTCAQPLSETALDRGAMLQVLLCDPVVS